MSVVLITGCSSGFGLETALAFARRGATTYASMRDQQRATALRERAAAEGLDLEGPALDVVQQGADTSIVAQPVVQAAEDPATPLHVLVGEAATEYIDLAARAGGYEGWAATVAEVFASVAGPRPAPAAAADRPGA
jgi:NAD(P)-dependent dehydrogenase (short-subunit alcohol dehydrogenase family)